jgi:hypothetical protein
MIILFWQLVALHFLIPVSILQKMTPSLKQRKNWHYILLPVIQIIFSCNNNSPSQSKPAEVADTFAAQPITHTSPQADSTSINSPALDGIFNRTGEKYYEKVAFTDTLDNNKVIVVSWLAPGDFDCHSCAPLLKCYEWRHDSSAVLEKAYYLGLYGG